MAEQVLVSLHEVTDGDGVVRIRMEPGPNMRWFEQGFYFTLGFVAASFVLWLVLFVFLAILIAAAD